MKSIKNFFSVTLPTLLVLLLIMEAFFRWVIPASNPPMGFFHQDEHLYTFSNKNKSGLNTIGKFAKIRAKWNINNMNWNAPYDYLPKKESTKLVAVIGDSFIEALQVDVGKSYPFLLREKLKKDGFEVYAFGKSGSPFSQYLHISRYVNKHFNPDILIVNLVHNDFNESVRELFPVRKDFLQLSLKDSTSIVETIPVADSSTAQFKPLKGLLYQSALFRYIYLNLQINKNRSAQATAKNVEGNIPVNELVVQKETILKAADYIAGTIKKENASKRIIFVMDAPRESIYNNTLGKSNITWINQMMKTLCEKHGIEFVDLTNPLEEDFKMKKQKFNFDIDGHWNEYGHQLISDILYNQIISTKK
jgi:lysophospholipase L1-like esterase